MRSTDSMPVDKQTPDAKHPALMGREDGDQGTDSSSLVSELQSSQQMSSFSDKNDTDSSSLHETTGKTGLQDMEVEDTVSFYYVDSAFCGAKRN